MQRILVTGANGQLGSDLIVLLRKNYGDKNVIGVDLSMPAAGELKGPHEVVDVTDRREIERVADGYDVDTVYHLASLLSAKGEKLPDLAWSVNLSGLKHILDLAVERKWQVFWPSSIAVFGSTTPKHMTPQHTILEPVTMYGLTKRTGELLCNYYHKRFAVDVRSVRYPGLISFSAPPGGGTTDYAIGMLRAAVEERHFSCFVAAETRLPMMYMPDAVQAALDLMNAPSSAVSIRTSYNVSAFSFSAEELEMEIRKKIPDFSCTYEPDYRDEIAASWPSSIDDSMARSDWRWNPVYDISAMVEEMIEKLRLVTVR